MKKFLSLLVITALSIGIVNSAKAAVLGFDTLSNTEIYDGYGGLNWENMWAYGGGMQGTGYWNGVVSPTKIAYNRSGQVANITSSTPFNFNGAHLTAAWDEPLNVKIEGFLGNSLNFTKTVVVNDSAPTWVDFNFANVDKLRIDTWTATKTEGFTQVVIDDFDFTPVPEPTTMLLGLAGIGGIFAVRRKKVC